MIQLNVDHDCLDFFNFGIELFALMIGGFIQNKFIKNHVSLMYNKSQKRKLMLPFFIIIMKFYMITLYYKLFYEIDKVFSIHMLTNVLSWPILTWDFSWLSILFQFLLYLRLLSHSNPHLHNLQAVVHSCGSDNPKLWSLDLRQHL